MDIETMSVRSDESGESSMWESEVEYYLFHIGNFKGLVPRVHLTSYAT